MLIFFIQLTDSAETQAYQMNKNLVFNKEVKRNNIIKQYKKF